MIKKKKHLEMPHVLFVLMVIMLFVTILSYIVPSGEFVRSTDAQGNEVVDPDQFNFIEQADNISLFDFFTAIYNGFVEGSTVIAALFISCGMIRVIEDTGSFGAGITKILEAGANNKRIKLSVIILFYVAFAIMGILGFGEASYPFFGITTATIMAVGYDRLSAIATIMMGSCAGFASGMLNMYTTGISQNIVGLPIFSGIEYRFICFLVFFTVGLISVLLYCRMITKNPEKSYVSDEHLRQLKGEVKIEGVAKRTKMNGKHIFALALFIVFLVIQGYCCAKKGWGLEQVAALDLIYVVVITIVFRMKPSTVCESMVNGAKEVLTAGLVIGMARSVMILLDQARIVDTLVYYMSSFLDGKSISLTILLILIFVTCLNFFVDSGSGKAVMMMPIMSPLGKILGINQQVMVLTYQFGDGFTDYLWPAGALVSCSLCKIDYGVWVRFAWKALGAELIVAYFMILIANAINLGPF